MPAMPQFCRLRNATKSSATGSHYHYDGLRRADRLEFALLFQYTWAGEGRIEWGRRPRAEQPLPAGHAFMVLIPSAHRYWYPGAGEPWEFSYAFLDLGDQARRARDLVAREGPVHAIAPESDLIEYLNALATGVHGRPDLLDDYTRSALAYRFLMELFRHFDPRGRVEAPPPLVQRALACIEERLGDDLSLADIAAHAGVSPQALIRAFRRRLGQTPAQALIGRRIERARRRLLETELPLKAIAAECGFRNDNYFCKVFRRRVGLTPDTFRRRGLREL